VMTSVERRQLRVYPNCPSVAMPSDMVKGTMHANRTNKYNEELILRIIENLILLCRRFYSKTALVYA
jgi:hypothetical protein